MFLVSCYYTVSSFSRSADVSLKNLALFMWLHLSESEPGKLSLSYSFFLPFLIIHRLFLLFRPYLFSCLNKFFQSFTFPLLYLCLQYSHLILASHFSSSASAATQFFFILFFLHYRISQQRIFAFNDVRACVCVSTIS